MLKSLFHKNYIFYGGSIIISRGLEYFVLFFAASYMGKDDYGQLEFYKKVVEVGSNVLAFGFPALILSYTKSKESKVYFYLLSILFVLALLVVLSFAGFYNPIWFFLLITMGFYGIFFTGGIAQSYQIVHLGSNYASIYKIVISIFFYGAVFGLIYFFSSKGEAYLYPAVALLPLALAFSYFDFKKAKIELRKIKRYWKLFRKLLYSSFTLVVSNFANLMFLYTDIFVIKLLSKSANSEIADFSFALNVASVLLLISMTLIQVDIEKLKSSSSYLKVLNKKIVVLTLLLTAFLIVAYYGVVHSSHFMKYEATFVLFLILMFGKIFASLSGLFGTYLVILKQFNVNLYINLIMLIGNVLVCILLYYYFGLLGVAFGSSFMLLIRYFIIRRFALKLGNIN